MMVLYANLVLQAIHGVDARSLGEQRRDFSTERRFDVSLAVVLVSNCAKIGKARDRIWLKSECRARSVGV